MQLVLAENEILYSRKISRLKRRMRVIKYRNQQLMRMYQMELISNSLLLNGKIPNVIKADFGKLYLKPKVTINSWVNMYKNFITMRMPNCFFVH